MNSCTSCLKTSLAYETGLTWKHTVFGAALITGVALLIIGGVLGNQARIVLMVTGGGELALTLGFLAIFMIRNHSNQNNQTEESGQPEEESIERFSEWNTLSKGYEKETVVGDQYLFHVRLKYTSGKGFYDPFTKTYLSYHIHKTKDTFCFLDATTGRMCNTEGAYYQLSTDEIDSYQPAPDPYAMPFIPDDGETKWISMEHKWLGSADLQYDKGKGFYDPKIKAYLSYHACASEHTYCYMNSDFGRMYSSVNRSYYQMSASEVEKYVPAPSQDPLSKVY